MQMDINILPKREKLDKSKKGKWSEKQEIEVKQ